MKNFDENSDIETHWIDLYPLNNNVIYFDSFDVEHIPKEIEIFIDRSIVVENNIFLECKHMVQ